MLTKVFWPGLARPARTPVYGKESGVMEVGVALYGAARVVIGQARVNVTFGSPSITLGQVLEKLAATYPRARAYLLDEAGMLPFHMRVLINDARPDPDATLATMLYDEDQVALLVAVAGGQRSKEVSPAFCRSVLWLLCDWTFIRISYRLLF